jgi:hypothetical protein
MTPPFAIITANIEDLTIEDFSSLITCSSIKLWILPLSIRIINSFP